MDANNDALSALLQRLRLSAGLFTEAAYCGNWAVNTAGQRMATFHLIESGDCWLRVQDAPPRQLRPGDFVLFPRDAQHMLTSSKDLPEDVVVNEPPPYDPKLPTTNMLCGYFEFTSRALWPLLDSLPEVVVLDLAQTAVGDTKTLLNLMIGESLTKRPGSAAVIDQLAYVLFVHVLRTHVESGASAGLLSALAHPQIGEALNRIHAAPEASWTLEQLATEVGMSRASFANKFRDLVDDTPMNYLIRWRMQVAVDLLTTTQRSMAQISEAVGYRSEAAFRNAFSKVTGEPPGAIRRGSRPG